MPSGAPRSSSHDTTLTYLGVRQTTRTVKVATAVGIETPSTTTEELDRQGRLWRVTEPSGDSGTNVTTTYTHDIGGRLKQASTPSGVTHNRSFETIRARSFTLGLRRRVLRAAGRAGGDARRVRRASP